MKALTVPEYIATTESGEKVILPDDAVTQGFGVLARRRSGKSYLVGDIEETFLARHDPFIVLDPAGAHYGIRYRAGKDERPIGPSGFEVLIVGGEHGDVPLNEDAGAQLAEIVVETNLSVVIDLKMSRPTTRKKFVAPFCDRLFEINRTPRHLIVEEAHELVPQQVRFPEQMAVLAAIERIVKGGGGQGIGFNLTSQRPASVNKDVLTQIDNLIVMRMSGPADIKAVADWFEHNVGDKAQLKAILATLPALKPGEAWMLSPEWMHAITRVKVRPRLTYHAGRTPKRGDKPVDVSKWSVKSAAEKFRKIASEKKLEVEEKRDREAKLQAEVERLRKELATKRSTPVPTPAPAPKIDKAVIDKAVASTAKRMVAARDREWKKAVGEYERAFNARIGVAMGKASEAFEGLTFSPPPEIDLSADAAETLKVIQHIQVAQHDVPKAIKAIQRSPVPRGTSSTAESNGDLKPPQQRILDVLAQFEAIGRSEVNQVQVAILSGASHRSSSYQGNRRELKDRGLVDYPRQGMLSLTDIGRQYAHVEGLSLTTEELQTRARALLSTSQRAILDQALRVYPKAIDKNAVADLAGTSASSSTFQGNLRFLRTAGMIDYKDQNGKPASGMIRAEDWLFLDAAA